MSPITSATTVEGNVNKYKVMPPDRFEKKKKKKIDNKNEKKKGKGRKRSGRILRDK